VGYWRPSGVAFGSTVTRRPPCPVGISGWLSAASNHPPRGPSHKTLILAVIESLLRHQLFDPLAALPTHCSLLPAPCGLSPPGRSRTPLDTQPWVENFARASQFFITFIALDDRIYLD
jgi:hypothetical protein